ncbi:aminopeptidase N [Microbacterium dextranolyticum]|uniref:Aminopeptidase N n=1 Tax=Microbacterium dextranolyticum TaxID=36806 RepID=A0A9W6HNA6_9MICO|nr:aminopeptidase N [Microbacterium dextranolyticum]MBM7462995.1 aminopeptidase N [Microbacterium dextranolyticum]GLJ95899.1 aminopeptidase [Microbacterium dextranolyticum]
MSSANLTRDETAARAAGIQLETVEVDLDVRGALTDLSFATSSTFTLRSSTTETWIDFIGESVDEVVVDGVARAVEWDGARVRITGLVPNMDHVAVVTIRGRGLYSTSGEGLHRFRDPADGETYLYTQYEPADCRRVYPCFEQPDLKARWRMSVSAPESWAVLSNGAEIARVGVEGGVRVSFAETSPLSGYITAVATGPYHRVDGVWDGPDGPVDLGVLCRASLARYLDADEILDVTRRGLTFFSESFGVTYPWGKYDQIFVPEINVGAMENPGLVTFTEHYVFRGAATAAQHEGRANTILHEMAHMWFGDLVTMRWWDDLWLKESFADYMGAHAAVAAGGFPDAWVTFASRRKGWAYVQDQLPTTHPIVADIPDLEAAKLNFDGITYAKGASVLKQLVAFVGEDAFFRGARHYFAAHAYGNTTLPDLLAALEEASGRDLAPWASAWLQTSGVSDLSVERVRGGEVELVRTDPRPDHVVVGLFASDGGRLLRRGELEADGVDARMRLAAEVPDGIALVLPNVDDRTYAKVHLDECSIVAVEEQLSTIDDAVARAVVFASLWNATRDGLLAVTRYLDAVVRHAPAEDNVALLGDALAHADAAISRYAQEQTRSVLARRWLDVAWQALQTATPGSDAQLAWARAVGAAAERDDARADELWGMLRGEHPVPVGLALDPELRWIWLTALAATGHATAVDIDTELALDPSSHGEIAHRTAMASRPDADVRAAAWQEAWADITLSNDHLDAVIAGVRAGGRRDLVAPFDADYFARIRPAWTERSIEIARRLVIGLFPASESLDLVDAWLETHADAPAALRRLVLEQRDGLARDLRVRAAQPSL